MRLMPKDQRPLTFPPFLVFSKVFIFRLSLRSLLTINCLDHNLPDHKLPGAAASMFFGVAATKRRLLDGSSRGAFPSAP